jgi:methionine synthase II (cobalamin-independent)
LTFCSSVSFLSDVYDPLAPSKIDTTDIEDSIVKAVDEVVTKQLDLGIAVITDGEMERETYFLHFVRRIKGVDTEKLVKKSIRNGE